MSADLATDLVGRLEMTKMRRCVALMPEKCRNQIVELLRYPKDSVGGAMTNDIIRLPLNITCEEAQTTVQKNADEVRFTSVIFVVDEDRQLRGSINLRELLAADGAQTLEELMDPYMQTLGAFQNSVEAAYRIVSGQLPAMPVIDASGRLIGAMTVEAAIARLVPATSGLQNLRVFA
jgi:magnesium transporter